MATITKEEFDVGAAQILQESPDRVILLKSPASDIKLTEELLGAEEGTLPNFVCNFKKGEESCANCGRHFSVLDLIKTALEVHSKEFLISVIYSNEYTRGEGPRVPICSDCGEKSGASLHYQSPTYYCLD